jgi:hypothetical protein
MKNKDEMPPGCLLVARNLAHTSSITLAEIKEYFRSKINVKEELDEESKKEERQTTQS